MVENGHLDSDFLYYLLDIQPCAYSYEKKEEKSDENSRFDLQIVIDPEQ